MKKHIFENNYYFPVLIVSFSLLVLMINRDIINPLVKYPLMLAILAFSFYLNPVLIIKTFSGQKLTTLTEKLILVLSYIILSVTFALMAILLFTQSENVILIAKFICIVNFVFLAASYFSKAQNTNVLINHLIVSFVFSTLISIL